MLKSPKVRSERHRRFISKLPCCVTGREGETQAAHIRVGNGAGMGLKSGDDCCIPMSWMTHLTQHSEGEKKFWGKSLKAAQQLAKDLYRVTGDEEQGRKLVREFRREFWNS